jgi:rSAM/selenodomain-associated transferase 2
MSKSTTISIIIPVLHEAEGINGIIAHLRGLNSGGTAEIIVADGDHGGSTINTIQDEQVIRTRSEKGRGVQMNRGTALASGDILLFLHADTLLPPNALSEIRKHMEGSRFVAGAFDLGIRTSRKIFRITELYVAFRTRLTQVPFGDQAIFIRKEYFERIGGFKPIPIMEDVELMTRIKKRGDPICIIPAKVLTSPRRWEKEGILFCTFRNWTIQMLYALGVPPEQLQKLYQEGGTAT